MGKLSNGVQKRKRDGKSAWSLIFDIETKTDARSVARRTLAFKRARAQKPKRAG